MKTIKLTLLIIVVAGISAGIFFWVQNSPTPDSVVNSENPFTRWVEQQIDSITTLPNNTFCKDYYSQVALNIQDFHEQNRFGRSKLENDQRKKILESNLYVAYSAKFIDQANYVLSGTVWNTDTLIFIQAEKNELQASSQVEIGSPNYEEFATIQTALDKYYQIESFISTCRSFGYSKTHLSARFPVNDVKSKISRAADLRRNDLENQLVNNCTRLQDDLREIPQLLFRKHVAYLDEKVTVWSGLFSHYSSQSDYSNNLYKPIKSEILALNNVDYNVTELDREYDRLLGKWSVDNSNAYNYDYQ